MELKDYITLEIQRDTEGLNKVLESLTHDELSWRPFCGYNSIGLTLFQVARFEDTTIQARVQGKPEIWETGKWCEKLKMSKDQAGPHYTLDQVNTFKVLETKALLAFFEAVHENTLSYVGTLKNSDFDKKVQTPRYGEVTLAFVFTLVIGHAQRHLGEMSYLRGLQRGMGK